uniref:Zinc fingers and homeoboxes 3b n=1 Tax=Oryzias sinensis TaxID=183150 RepID=A0A8C7XVK5_9TELE
MASKRKSTMPCMIPSKIIHPIEDVERDSPVLLHQPRVSGGDTNESSKSDLGDDKDGAGNYTCKLCNFETHDLNLFLDHVYSVHPEFRAEPSFVCMNCAVSAPKFEGLALHNARVHPSTLATTLQLRKRERRVVVEQTLSLTELGKDSEISITKTPIMRMLKGKSEPKRIVVSHPLSEEALSDPQSVCASREGGAREPAAVTVTHVPTIVHNGATKATLPSAIQIVNGSTALPLLKTPITQVVSVAQNRGVHHSAAVTAPLKVSSASSSSSSKNLPKVMIPLSSIPTYSASMDESSFLKTSFSKFPYPTKAELCYLTVVTKFPEEQIKIWFTAQRLKQGISWSPEEIEEARRKMFNTIIQTTPASTQSQSHPSPAQHTITVLPASLGAAGIPQFLQGSLVSQGGVIVTQPVVANGIQVSSAPVALAVTPKPQAAARPMMQGRPAAALVAEKGVSMVVGTVGSSSAGSNIIVSSKSGGGDSNSAAGGQAGVINLSLGSSNHSKAKAASVNGKHASSTVDSSDKSKGNSASRVAAKVTDVSKEENSSAAESDCGAGSGSNVVVCSAATGSDGQKRKDVNGSSSTTSSSPEDNSSARDSPNIKIDEALSPSSKSSSASPAPISSSRTSINAFLDPSFYKGKKSQEQLTALKDSFQANQFPDQDEVDRLIGITGLTVREVRKWFSDRRYHFRNLKGGRCSTGGQGKPSTGSGSGPSTPGGGSAGTPMDLSDSNSNSGAKTPQQNSPDAFQNSAATATPTSPTTPSRRTTRPPSSDFTAIRYKERDPHQVKALEASFAENADPPGEEVDRLRSETKMTRREIHGWFTDKRKRMAAERKKEEAERLLKEGEDEMEVDEDGKPRDDGSGEPKVNPIKINLKMLKVTEASGKLEGEGSENLTLQSPAAFSPIPTSSSNSKPPQSSSQTAKASHSPKPTTVRGTGLPRSEVVRWFGDCRYVQKNGPLKWLEEYQNMALEEEMQAENMQILQAHLDAQGRLEESQLQELVEKTGLTADLVRHWFSTQGSLLQNKPTAAQTTGAVAAGVAGTTGSSPLEQQPAGGMDQKMEQSVSSFTTDAEKTNAEDILNASKEMD